MESRRASETSPAISRRGVRKGTLVELSASSWRKNEPKEVAMSRARTIVIALVTVFLGDDLLLPPKARANSEVVETGRLLAILLDAGRVTIGANQSLINDPERGDKNFTPEVFEKQLSAKFKERANVDRKSTRLNSSH